MVDRFKIFCAVNLILIKDGKILLQRRNNPEKYGYGMLGMPGGHLEENENIYDAIKREIKEELNIDLTNIEIVQVMHVKGEGVYDNYFFTAEYTGEIRNMEKDESKTIEWADLDSGIKDLLPYQRYALDKYLESKDNKFTIYGWD